MVYFFLYSLKKCLNFNQYYNKEPKIQRYEERATEHWGEGHA